MRFISACTICRFAAANIFSLKRGTEMDGYIIALIAVGCVVVCLTAWGVWENHAVQCNSVEVASEKLPAAFDGFTFAHISDLHNAKIG